MLDQAINAQLKYLDNLLKSLANHQTNMVPGFLASSIYRLIAFNISNKSIRSSLLYNDSKLIGFLQNLMDAVSMKVTKVNPQLEYSYLYLNISDTVKATFEQYPTLSLDIIPGIYQSAANMFLERVLLPSVSDFATTQEMINMKNRYIQLVQHFCTILYQKQQSIQKLKELQKMHTQAA